MFSNNSALESQQWAQHFETVRAKARTLAHNLNVTALNVYKNDVQDLGSKNIVQYEIDCLGWYEAVKKATAGMNLLQLKNYLNERTWDEVSLQIIYDRINNIANLPPHSILEEKLSGLFQVVDFQGLLRLGIGSLEKALELHWEIDVINERLDIKDKPEGLSYPPSMAVSPDFICGYLAEIKPLRSALDDDKILKRRESLTKDLIDNYWIDKLGLFIHVAKKAGYPDFEDLIKHYIKWKGNSTLNEPTYSDENNVYQQLNTRQMAIDIGLRNLSQMSSNTALKNIHDKHSKYRSLFEKIVLMKLNLVPPMKHQQLVEAFGFFKDSMSLEFMESPIYFSKNPMIFYEKSSIEECFNATRREINDLQQIRMNITNTLVHNSYLRHIIQEYSQLQGITIQQILNAEGFLSDEMANMYFSTQDYLYRQRVIEMQVEQIYQAAVLNLSKKVGELKIGQTRCPLTRQTIHRAEMCSAQLFRNVFLTAASCIAKTNPEEFSDKPETAELSNLINTLNEDERAEAEKVLESLCESGSHPAINDTQLHLLAEWGITGKNFVNARSDNINKISARIQELEIFSHGHVISNIAAFTKYSYHKFSMQAKETIQKLENVLQDRQVNVQRLNQRIQALELALEGSVKSHDSEEALKSKAGFSYPKFVQEAEIYIKEMEQRLGVNKLITFEYTRQQRLTPSVISILNRVKTKNDGDNIPEPEVALRRAAADGLADVIQALVENVQDLDLNQCGNTSGRTALHFATIYGRTNVVSQLITLGARQDIRDKVKNQLASEYAGASNNAKIRNIFRGE